MKCACPACGQPVEADPEMAGLQIACPLCARMLSVRPSRAAPTPPGLPALPPPPRSGPQRWYYFLSGAFLLAAGLGVTGFGSAERAVLKEVRVYPTNIHLATAPDRQSVVVQALRADGVTMDVSARAKFQLLDPSLVRIDQQTLAPLADGQTELRVQYDGHTVVVPVTVAQAKVENPISFRLDIMPIFMKAGCNAGSCHGSSRGKDGFHLSLFGYDPADDYFRLTQELVGRRVNPSIPEESLLLEKATGKVPHTGGERFKEDSDLYRTLARWLTEGAPDDRTNVAKVISLELMPRQAVLEGEGPSQRLTVRARYSDGTDRDVTSLALFLSNNETSVKVSPEGMATGEQRGEAFVMARFSTFTVGAQMIVIPKQLDYAFPEVAEHNYIDKYVNEKLRKLRITPSDLCDDATFLRRVHLDITGTLPTVEEVHQFLENGSTGKRDDVIDALLEREEFANLWVMKWAELLQIRSRNDDFSYKAALLYHDWLRDKITRNVPINQIVQELLTASGGTFKNPAANYYQVERDTLKSAENVAQVFMGMRIQCAQCHNHPFDRWTMDDYYSFGAFFAQVGRKSAEDPREYVIFDRNEGEVRHPVGKRNMPPKFLGGATPEIKDRTRREVLAQWIASPENPYFARNIGNILWAHFMGQGIIEPVDDVRVSNPPSNPELLEALGQKLTAYNYDFKKLVRDICTSRTYQLSTRANESNELDLRNFSHASIRRLRAEVLLDCINQVTEKADKFQGLPAGSRAVEIADGNVNTYFLTTFGRATRTTVCSCEVKTEPSLSQALHLLNGNTTHDKIQNSPVIKELLQEFPEPSAVIEQLYLRCLGRRPSAEELEKLQAFFGPEEKPEPVLADVFWALLNSKEFIFNH